MRWSSCRRSIAALLAVLSLVVEGGTAGLHVCPMHDGATHAAGSTAGASHTATPTGAHHAAGNTQRHSQCCTCVGPCCGAPPATYVAAGELSVVVDTPPAESRPAWRVGYIPSSPEHARPPSLGPPVTHIG